jgi:hypothetical protein
MGTAPTFDVRNNEGKKERKKEGKIRGKDGKEGKIKGKRKDEGNRVRWNMRKNG